METLIIAIVVLIGLAMFGNFIEYLKKRGVFDAIGRIFFHGILFLIWGGMIFVSLSIGSANIISVALMVLGLGLGLFHIILVYLD